MVKIQKVCSVIKGTLSHACNIKTKNLLNGYVVTAGGVQETELNTQTKHCSAKYEKYVNVKVNNG